MSFADSLVSSWLKPASGKLQHTHKDYENELKEHMRRPARLGVGASVPQAASLTREQAKLKHALTGKKRAHDDDEAGGASGDDDDDMESRGKAVQKRARLDPFSTNKKKKKGVETQAKAGPSTREQAATSPKKPPLKEGESEQAAAPSAPAPMKVTPLDEKAQTSSPEGSAGTSNATPKKKKKKNRGNAEVLSSQASGTLVSSSNLASPSVAMNGVSSSQMQGSNSAASPTQNRAAPPTTATPTSPPKTKPPLPASSPPVKKRGSDADILKQPILNLDGPPPSDESEDDDEKPEVTITSSSKKRRRRKKKKKNGAVPAGGEQAP
ncbi:uncharacterized protein SCHCODRAFT_02666966 [Schizophyllum commune H4-8]|uniref:Uncharacterized protein n=1 Tax=Schizophyllum commune (strain H4-8 / FGSC 9210) TaxID=578458 RepID=D8PS00_SCHCM|nr:uncharacterized protein SCHCODRAFT_02666966 [Schizophyllum commune H4-8]KAI5893894.1 hypothetical protein SCHCODRAFT_02666966 [Schizophyllum commune H4-8]